MISYGNTRLRVCTFWTASTAGTAGQRQHLGAEEAFRRQLNAENGTNGTQEHTDTAVGTGSSSTYSTLSFFSE